MPLSVSDGSPESGADHRIVNARLVGSPNRSLEPIRTWNAQYNLEATRTQGRRENLEDKRTLALPNQPSPFPFRFRFRYSTRLICPTIFAVRVGNDSST